MSKRTYFLLGVCLLLVLAACGGSNTDAASSEPAAANSQMTNASSKDVMAAENDDMMHDDQMNTADDGMMDDQKDDEMMESSDDMAMHEGDEAMTSEDMPEGDADMAMHEDDEAMTSEDMSEGDADMAMHEDDAAMASDEMKDDMAMDDAMMDRPDWQKLPLVNARTGETFTFADFAGKAVYVEPMATWCTNCRQQLTNVREAIGQFDSDHAVFVAISVETNIDAATLAAYADNEGFDWLFAVATPELLTSLSDQFGQSITNPPSTPHFVIYPDGTTSDLVTGIDSVTEIASLVQVTLTQ